MRHNTVKWRVDPVLAPDQFSVARPLRPEDLDRRVIRYGIYLSLPAPNGVPWSEYVRTHRNRSRSVSSSTEAMESDHARYVTRKIAWHARSMATGTRSLPTNSPIPYYPTIERGYMSEGSQEGVYVPSYVDPSEHTINVDGTDYHPDISETDKVSTYTGLDDYDTLFGARHGRGALDPVPRMSEQMMVNPLERVTPAHDVAHLGQREQVSVPKESLQHRVVSPSSEIIGEGVAIFTDMTETILNVLDQQIAMAPDTQQSKGLSPSDNQMKGILGGKPITSNQKEGYLDLFLPVVENYRISNCFCGY